MCFALAKKFLGTDNVLAGVIAPAMAADIPVSDHSPAVVAFDQFGAFTDYSFHELREPLAASCFKFAEFLHNSKRLTRES
jgi:hypothetical protein